MLRKRMCHTFNHKKLLCRTKSKKSQRLRLQAKIYHDIFLELPDNFNECPENHHDQLLSLDNESNRCRPVIRLTDKEIIVRLGHPKEFQLANTRSSCDSSHHAYSTCMFSTLHTYL